MKQLAHLHAGAAKLLQSAAGTTVLAIFLVSAAACSTTEPRPILDEPSFSDLDPFVLDVAEIRVSSNYRPPLRPPNVEHKFAVTLTDAVGHWAEDRLAAGGVSGEAALVIEDASVVETVLTTTGGFGGLFRNENTIRYDAMLRVRLVAVTSTDRGEVEATIARSQTMLENASLNDRDALWHEMMTAMLDELNASMEESIPTYFDALLK